MIDDLIKWLKGFHSGQLWFVQLKSKETIRLYLPYLKAYCDATGKNPNELIHLKMEGQRQVGTNKEFQAEELHDIVITQLAVPDSVKSNISDAVKSFYKHNRRPLINVKKFDKPSPRERTPTLEDIMELDNVATTQRDKALLWLLTTAPFRESTITKLKWSDFKETSDKELPIIVNIEDKRLKGSGKGKYRGIKQICFVNHFVCDKITRYIKEAEAKGYTFKHEDPVFIGYRGENGNGKGNGDKLKPLSDSAIRYTFQQMSLNAWHDLESKRYSPHDFRRFAETMMEKARVNPNWINITMGHKVKGVKQHYSQPSLEELKEQFKDVLPYIIPPHKQKVKSVAESMQFVTNTAWQLIEMQYNSLKDEIDTLQALMENAKSPETRNILEVQLTMKKDQLKKYEQMIQFKKENNKHPPPQ
jgi:integrase